MKMNVKNYESQSGGKTEEGSCIAMHLTVGTLSTEGVKDVWMKETKNETLLRGKTT